MGCTNPSIVSTVNRRDSPRLGVKVHNGDHEDIVIPADAVEVQGRVEWVFHPPRR